MWYHRSVSAIGFLRGARRLPAAALWAACLVLAALTFWGCGQGPGDDGGSRHRLPVDPGSIPGGYGAGVNPTGDPIGGGEGYSRIVAPDSADYVVSTTAGLLAALSRASSGDVVYVEDGARINLTGREDIAVGRGVTLASGRGRGGSEGALLYADDTSASRFPSLIEIGQGGRVTGLRVRGPNGTTSRAFPLYTGLVAAGDDVEVDNCEIFNWPQAGAGVGSRHYAHFHHNHIHHCQADGFGYGVIVAGGTALIEANYFDYYRHAIAGARGYPASSYEARYNICGPNATNTAFDMHGGNDGPSWGFDEGPDAGVPAGGTVLIHHNTFQATGGNRISVGIRGVPVDTCQVYGNWTYWDEQYSEEVFKQYLEGLGLQPYVRMQVHDNWYGTGGPPAAE